MRVGEKYGCGGVGGGGGDGVQSERAMNQRVEATAGGDGGGDIGIGKGRDTVSYLKVVSRKSGRS